MAFSPPVLGYLVKKGLQKGGSPVPLDPPGYALVKHNIWLTDSEPSSKSDEVVTMLNIQKEKKVVLGS